MARMLFRKAIIMVRPSKVHSKWSLILGARSHPFPGLLSSVLLVLVMKLMHPNSIYEGSFSKALSISQGKGVDNGDIALAYLWYRKRTLRPTHIQTILAHLNSTSSLASPNTQRKTHNMRLFVYLIACAGLASILPEVLGGPMQAPATHVINDFLFDRSAIHAEGVDADPNVTWVPRMRPWRGKGPDPSTDEDWNKLKCKGTTLIQMMDGDDKEAGQLFSPPIDSAESAFTDFPGSFTTWGWLRKEKDAFINEKHLGVEDALKGLGVGTDVANYKRWEISHGDRERGMGGQKYKVGDKEYQCTGGHYEITTSVKDGVMVISDEYSAASQGRWLQPPVQGDDLPKLQRASDMIFGEWATQAKGHVDGLRLIMVWTIVNVPSCAAIRRSLMANGKDTLLERWPTAYSYLPDSDEGKALLGMPNGVAIGFILAQHKKALGHKKVKKMWIFRHSSTMMTGGPVVAYEVGDAE
ncbi:hypothetical protein P154DRAFT_581961 [Amniculicola lignicola CBS 123094]|uniref:Uncharacterized protein n=1 Tax=Amniculicola lignicola CBS 123094 TaxID=1392246 RepID=A0A6A5W567_9PLEO|nr:hypothetical protein P154DRAFT_581961 [Amniculicola lignicola CBS 123094]